MLELGTDANNGRPWSVKIYRSWRLGDLWVYNCFPYYTDGRNPPYPGFMVLRAWLTRNCPSAAHESMLRDGSSCLEVTFNDAEEAMMFRLTHGV